MPTLEQKAKRLLELRGEIKKQDDAYKASVEPFKRERDELTVSIMDTLKRAKSFSQRFSFATVTRAVRKTMHVVDEPLVVSWLKGKGLAKEYVSERLNDRFVSLGKGIADGSAPLPAGVEISETEFISVRTSDPDKEKRKVVQD